jgi:hypothetical protein
MPCHWKGVAVMFVVIIPTVAAIFLAHWVAPSADWLEAPILLSGLLLLHVITKRLCRWQKRSARRRANSRESSVRHVIPFLLKIYQEGDNA